MRIDRLLANSGYGTRSDIKDMIRRGRVSVDGVVCKDPGLHVTDSSSVTIDGAEVASKRYLYFMLDKPDSVLTAMEDKRLPTVADFIPPELRGLKLSPVGRLDYHTTGLLLITNDGELSHRLTSPKYGVAKTYLIEYSGSPLDASCISELAAGLTLTDTDELVTLRPAHLDLISPGVCKITLTEGKTHEIRRIISHYGRTVVTLRRVALGPLSLSETAPGHLLELTNAQVAALKECVSL